MTPSYTAIAVEGVGKCFTLGPQAGRSARQAISGLIGGFIDDRFRTPGPVAAPEFWALRDVSFEVGSGEIVGVVGRNGAGKSVLFKLISRVARPTRGRIAVRGRVAPLLELGAGFHPELTGRENIYLNGVILGMRRREVHARVDAIVAFAGLGAFLETPIKRYSSGMRMRLAFAVAAHLDRDIFLLDEVLMVGDQEFQQKCLIRLRELADEGRTVMLVSHGDNLMESLCTRALLFDAGRLLASGAPAEISRQYARLRPPPPPSADVAR
jgi:lipopolysaccharide transport system ATP-binding protein